MIISPIVSSELRRGGVCHRSRCVRLNGAVVSVPVAQVCGDLLELLSGVSGGRSDQGRDHPVAVVLALAAAAVVAGMRGYTAITGWGRRCPGNGPGGAVPACGCPACGATVEDHDLRVLTDADAEAVDAAVGRWGDGPGRVHP